MSLLSLEASFDAGQGLGYISYGVFIVSFIACLYALIWRKKTKNPNYVLLCGAGCMFFLSTVTIFLSSPAVMPGTSPSGQSGGTQDAWLSDSSTWQEVARISVIGTNLAFADLVLIYRCYIVWDARWKVVIGPLTLWMATAITNVMMIVRSVRLGAPIPTFVNSVTDCFTAVLSIVLAQNVIITALIAIRIWSVTAATENSTGNLYPVMAVILESGAVYVASLVAFLVTYAVGNNAQYVLLDLLSPMVGIAFTVPIALVGLGLTTPHNRPYESSSPTELELQRFALPTHRVVSVDLPSNSEGDVTVGTLRRVRGLTRDGPCKFPPQSP